MARSNVRRWLRGRCAQVPEMRACVRAVPEHLPALRHALCGWASRAGLPDADRSALTLASYEAMANVVAHAYPGHRAGLLEVRASRPPHRDTVTVTVIDHGQWQARCDGPAVPTGRGLSLIEALATDAAIEHASDGTTVRMSWPCPHRRGR